MEFFGLKKKLTFSFFFQAFKHFKDKLKTFKYLIDKYFRIETFKFSKKNVYSRKKNFKWFLQRIFLMLNHFGFETISATNFVLKLCLLLRQKMPCLFAQKATYNIDKSSVLSVQIRIQDFL